MSNNNIDWRKSNATASLLEMVALSLVGETQQNGVYQKYLRDEGQEVQSGPIANEIYLYGRTMMGSIDETVSIVALDLFMRITDGGGVGKLEHDERGGRHALNGKDDRELPTMFGTSSPHAVIFPVQEVALAYARLSASHLLPRLVIRPPQPEISAQDRAAWAIEWHAVAAPEVSSLANQYAVPPPRQFSRGEFDGIEPGDLDTIWTELEERQLETDQQIKAVVARKEAEERQQINTVPAAPPGEYISPMFRKVIHLLQLEAEYKQAKSDQEKYHVVEPSDKRPRWRNYPWYALPIIGNRLKAGDRESLRRKHNEILDERVMWDRHRLLLDSLERLLAETRTRLNDALNWFTLTGESLKSQRTILEQKAHASGAWHGRLDKEHPHLRHIYHLNSLYADSPPDKDTRNRAAERLYLKTTCPDLDEEAVEKAVHNKDTDALDGLVEARIARFINGCVQYLTTGRYGGRAATHNMDAELERHSSDSLVDKVVGFFYEYYVDKFSKLNLFDLLREGSGQDQDGSLERYLSEHLNFIKERIRPMIDFGESLWSGAGGLDANLYLGMHWRDDAEKATLKHAVNTIGVLNKQNQAPDLQLHEDPHQLHVLYGKHGISLSMMQDFYRDINNTMMACYIRHQSAWFGKGQSQQQIFPDPTQRKYGSNGRPVHSCSKMEELVCNPAAFGYDVSLPHTQRYTTNLIGRVIRDATSVPGAQTWNGNAVASSGAGPAAPGTWNVMAPGGGSAPTGTPGAVNAPGPLPATPPIAGASPVAPAPGAAGPGAGTPQPAGNPPASNPMPTNPPFNLPANSPAPPNPAPSPNPSANPPAPNPSGSVPPWLNKGP